MLESTSVLLTCFGLGGEQPRVLVIFQLKGKHLSKIEKELWVPYVDIYLTSTWSQCCYLFQKTGTLITAGGSDDDLM